MMPDNNASNRICDKGTRVVMPDVSVRHMSASAGHAPQHIGVFLP